MRSALALLVTISGCNWVFGLEKTYVYDGGVDAPDAPPSIRTRLVWATPKAGSTQLDYVGIGPDNLPMVQVGKPLGMGELQTVEYAPDGSFAIPFSLREAPHRIVYTLPGETLVHEVQWSVSGATLVVPHPTRATAPAVPTGSGYDLTPTGTSAPPFVPFLMTTGVFTATRGAGFSFGTGSNTKFTFANAKPLFGSLAAPEGSKGDKIVLADWVNRGGGMSSIGGYAVASVDLMTGALTPAQPAWVATTHSPSTNTPADPIPTVPVGSADSRLLAVSNGPTSRDMRYGASPNINYQGFVNGEPMMFSFMESPSFAPTFTLADPTTDMGLTKVFMARESRTRTVDSALLPSSIATITTSLNVPLPISAPLALNIKLSTTDISTDTNYQSSSQATSLKWDPESFTADDFVVTLYEIPASGPLVARRVYQVLTPSVSVDGSLLDAGHKYTFSITSRSGFPNAKQGDYTTVSYPFTEATTFSGAFTVQ